MLFYYKKRKQEKVRKMYRFSIRKRFSQGWIPWLKNGRAKSILNRRRLFSSFFFKTQTLSSKIVLYFFLHRFSPFPRFEKKNPFTLITISQIISRKKQKLSKENRLEIYFTLYNQELRSVVRGKAESDKNNMKKRWKVRKDTQGKRQKMKIKQTRDITKLKSQSKQKESWNINNKYRMARKGNGFIRF